MVSGFLDDQPGGVDARRGEADHPALGLDRGLDRAIGRVIARDACSGCGACVSFDSGLVMQEDRGGYLRPLRRSAGRQSPGAVALLRRVCPDVSVSANASPGTIPHELFGAHHGVWKAWGIDGEMRRIGSSGGVLRAFSPWHLHSGRTARVVSAAAGSDPRRSAPVTIPTGEAALDAAGSRYAPVEVLSNPDTYLPGTTVVGKPCEASAAAAIARVSTSSRAEQPTILSFFCAGTPSSHATRQLLADLGFSDENALDELSYRGDGWPGMFSVRAGERAASVDHNTSWGKTLGPSTQWRCKICPDGVGESADIVAADYWRTDERGFPVFTEGLGQSAVIARSSRGLEILMAAQAAGVIYLETISMDSLATVQPLQRNRRRLLAARALGSVVAGRLLPRYRGFSLTRLTLRTPLAALTVARGTYRRVRRTLRMNA